MADGSSFLGLEQMRRNNVHVVLFPFACRIPVIFDIQFLRVSTGPIVRCHVFHWMSAGNGALRGISLMANYPSETIELVASHVTLMK